MSNTKNKVSKILLLVVPLLLLICIIFYFSFLHKSQNNLVAETEQEIEQFKAQALIPPEISVEIKPIQEQFFAPLSEFTAHITSDEQMVFMDGIIATVNGWPITKGELLERKWQHQSIGEAVDDTYIFNLLIEEKIQLSQAQKFGVLPTTDEVIQVVNERKQEVTARTGSGAGIDEYRKKLAFDEAFYWTVYEPYDEYRFIALSNLSEALQNNGIIKSLEPSEKVYFWEYLQKQKDSAQIKNLIKSQQYQYMPDKIFSWKKSLHMGATLGEIVESIQKELN